MSLTCNNWRMLSEANVELAYRYLEIMCLMNRPTYGCEPADVVVRRMIRRPCEYYYYASDRCEIVCGFRWMRRTRRFRLMSIGFVGDITPAEALELLVRKMAEFLHQKNVDRLTAVQPQHMENPGIVVLYSLARQHPHVQMTGGHRIAGGLYWWIRIDHERLTEPLNARSTAGAKYYAFN